MKWYQLHLSTLLAVMLLASLFVWLNVREKNVPARNLVFSDRDGNDVLETPASTVRGWPLAFELWHDNKREHDWYWTALIRDVIGCVLLLALAAAGIEWATRRMRQKSSL